jgi:hypothetical protein
VKDGGQPYLAPAGSVDSYHLLQGLRSGRQLFSPEVDEPTGGHSACDDLPRRS